MIKFAVLAVLVLGALYLAGGVQLMAGITSLTDKDRIFTNVYGFQGADLKSARRAATGTRPPT